MTEEVCHESGSWQFVKLLRGTHLLDLTLIHHRNSIGHGHGFLLIVGDMKEGQSDVTLDLFQLRLHLTSKFEVQGAERFVQEQQCRSVDNCPSQRHPLLLSTGKLLRTTLGEVIEFHQAKRLVGLDHGIANSPPFKAKSHVVDDTHVRKECVALEHRVHRALIGLRLSDISATNEDAPSGRFFETRDQPEGGRLATTRWAQKREKRPRWNRQVEVLDCGEPRKPLGDANQFEVCTSFCETTLRHLSFLL